MLLVDFAWWEEEKSAVQLLSRVTRPSAKFRVCMLICLKLQNGELPALGQHGKLFLRGTLEIQIREEWKGYKRAPAEACPNFAGLGFSFSSSFKYRYKLVHPIPKTCAARRRFPWHMSRTRWMCILRISSRDKG